MEVSESKINVKNRLHLFTLTLKFADTENSTVMSASAFSFCAFCGIRLSVAQLQSVDVVATDRASSFTRAERSQACVLDDDLRHSCLRNVSAGVGCQLAVLETQILVSLFGSDRSWLHTLMNDDFLFWAAFGGATSLL